MSLLQTLGTGQTKLQRVPNNGLCLAFPLTTYSQPANFDLIGTSFTLEFWLNINSFTNPGPQYNSSETRQTLVLAGSGNSGYLFYLATDPDGSGGGRVSLFNYAAGQRITNSVSHAIAEWFHLRVDYDAAAAGGPQVRFWQNNVLGGGGTFSTPMNPAHSFCLGHIDSNRTANILFGQVDELRWWRTVRNDAQNANSWRQRNNVLLDISTASMACCYNFEDQNTSGIADYADGSGNGVFLRDSYNSSSGAQRGSTAPLLGVGGTATGQLLTI